MAGPSVFAAVVFLALYQALKHLNKSYAALGALAGFVSPSVIGWVKGHTGSFAGGLLVVSASLVCGAVLVLLVPRAVDRGEPA